MGGASNSNSGEPLDSAAEDARIAGIIDRRRNARNSRRKPKWPVKRNRPEEFSKPDLTKLRLYKSAKLEHTAVKTNKQATCALCSTTGGKKRTQMVCSLCEVPLCDRSADNDLLSRFHKWNHNKDLLRVRREVVRQLKERRLSSQEDRQRRSLGEDV